MELLGPSAVAASCSCRCWPLRSAKLSLLPTVRAVEGDEASLRPPFRQAARGHTPAVVIRPLVSCLRSHTDDAPFSTVHIHSPAPREPVQKISTGSEQRKKIELPDSVCVVSPLLPLPLFEWIRTIGGAREAHWPVDNMSSAGEREVCGCACRGALTEACSIVSFNKGRRDTHTKSMLLL